MRTGTGNTVSHTITTDGNGKLYYEDGYKLPVYAGSNYIDVGCHRITRQAWELLKKLVDGEKK